MMGGVLGKRFGEGFGEEILTPIKNGSTLAPVVI